MNVGLCFNVRRSYIDGERDGEDKNKKGGGLRVWIRNKKVVCSWHGLDWISQM
jgi:hypothetical protein